MARRVAAVRTYTQVQVRKRWGNILRSISGKVARVIQVHSGMEEGVLRCILGRKNSLVTG